MCLRLVYDRMRGLRISIAWMDDVSCRQCNVRVERLLGDRAVEGIVPECHICGFVRGLSSTDICMLLRCRR